MLIYSVRGALSESENRFSNFLMVRSLHRPECQTDICDLTPILRINVRAVCNFHCNSLIQPSICLVRHIPIEISRSNITLRTSNVKEMYLCAPILRLSLFTLLLLWLTIFFIPFTLFVEISLKKATNFCYFSV